MNDVVAVAYVAVWGIGGGDQSIEHVVAIPLLANLNKVPHGIVVVADGIPADGERLDAAVVVVTGVIGQAVTPERIGSEIFILAEYSAVDTIHRK